MHQKLHKAQHGTTQQRALDAHSCLLRACIAPCTAVRGLTQLREDVMLPPMVALRTLPALNRASEANKWRKEDGQLVLVVPPLAGSMFLLRCAFRVYTGELLKRPRRREKANHGHGPHVTPQAEVAYTYRHEELPHAPLISALSSLPATTPKKQPERLLCFATILNTSQYSHSVLNTQYSILDTRSSDSPYVEILE